MKPERRRFCAMAGAGLLNGWLGTTAAGAAGQFPERPVTIVVPAPAGSLPDVFCRKIAERLAQRWNQQVNVENRPGGATAVGAKIVASAAADGHTLLYAPFNTLVLNPLMTSSLSYDPVADFTPVTVAGRAPLVLAVNTATGVQSLSDLVELGKRSGQPLRYGSPGKASMPHLFAALLANRTNLAAEHVPAASGPKAMEDLLEGRVHFVFDAAVSTQAHIAGGRLRALGVTSRNRIREFPEVPTLIELGASDGDWTLWGGFVAPAATPPARIAELNAAIRAENERGGFVDDIPGTERLGTTPDGFGQLLAAERVRWKPLVEASGVRLD